MTDTKIKNVDAVITFEEEVITASPEATAAARANAEDAARLKALLQPIVLEIFEDALSTYMRARG